jgi:A/G-specific adenine glycosylase
MHLTNQQIQQFRALIFPYYTPPLARELPWRKTDDPYAILVSEIMLQQTQVSRVIDKYKAWIRRFPTHFELARADMSAILPYWTGLGYNRRVQYLKRCADEIVNRYHGIFPKSHEILEKLPGVGPYTARALCVYAFNQPLALIETNVRAVYIHHFFPDKEAVSDDELLPVVQQTLDSTNPRAWFNALMDYGTFLKQQTINPSRKSRHYVKQSPLRGSVREVRGWILKQLAVRDTLATDEVLSEFENDQARVMKAIESLVGDAFIVNMNQRLKLKTISDEESG